MTRWRSILIPRKRVSRKPGMGRKSHGPKLDRDRAPVELHGLLAALQSAQKRPSFFDEHCASKDYDGCDDADGFKRMRVTLLEKPLRPFDCPED
jgi:hypothetical protein